MKSQIDNRRSQHQSQHQHLKKSILWNVVEPGDPYDIKKSTIAKLPGDNKVFMGNKLELVCLLQAAEIQRLALNLQEYRNRFHEVEKGSLDRHSYEVQIKELAGKLQGQQSIRTENIKLKKFSQRLNQELQQTKIRLSSGTSQLNNNYQQALSQVQILTDKNQQLSSENQHLKQLISTKNSENQQLQDNIRRLQQSVQDYNDQIRKFEQYEQKFLVISQQIQRLNGVLKKKTEENYYLNEQLKQNKTYVITKKQENQFLQKTQIQLKEQIQTVKMHLKRAESDQKAARQVDRLNGLLTKLQRENEELHVTLMQTEEKINYYSTTLNQKNYFIQELEQSNTKYESSSTLIGRQIQRLNAVLKTKLDEVKVLQDRLSRATEQNQFYSNQLSVLERQSKEAKSLQKQLEQLQLQLSNEQASKSKLSKTNSDLLCRIKQLSLQAEKHSTYEEKITQLNEEIKQINQLVQSTRKQNRALQSRVKEYENVENDYRRNTKQMAQLKSLMLQEDANKKALNQRISDLSRKSNQYQKIVNQLSAEVNRLNQILKLKLKENNELEARLTTYLTDNQKLEAQIAKFMTDRSKLQDYENKFALLSLEIERLNNTIKIRGNEKLEGDRQNDQLKRLITSLREQVHQYELKLNRVRSSDQNQQKKLVEYQNQIYRLNQVLKGKMEEMEMEIRSLNQQNRQLRIKLQEQGNRQKELADLERLNSLLRLKVEESTKWEASNSELVQKIDYAEGNIQELISENRSLKIKIDRCSIKEKDLTEQLNDYKVKVQNIFQQIQRLHQMLQTMKIENNELRRQNATIKKQTATGLTLKQKNDKLLKEIERLNLIVSQQTEELKQLRMMLSQDYSLDRRLKEQLSLIVVLFAQIETLRRRIDDKQKEIEVVRRQSIVALKD